MGGERGTSRQRREDSPKRKRHKHLSRRHKVSKSRSRSRSRSEKRHSKTQKKRRPSSCESSNLSSSSSESSRSASPSPARKKRKKCKEKKTKRHSDKDKKKKKKHHHHHHHKKVKDAKLKTSNQTVVEEVSVIGPALPGNGGPKNCTKTADSGSRNAESGTRIMKPMTKEEWEKKQSEVRRVYDPETGRHRLIKGEGEIIEEIVSRDRHKEINKIATRGDGLFYQLQAGLAKQH